VEPKVLTSLQVSVLEILFEHGLGDKGYYFTGGSALAEFYLQHRYSDDLDVFTRSARSIRIDGAEFRQLLTSRNFDVLSSSEGDEFVRLFVESSDAKSEPLKIEFARDAKAQVSPFKKYGTIVVDSFEDIAVNKICAILGREPPEPKDFVDLYFILHESSFSLEYLVGRAREKEAAFDNEDGILFFATNLLHVSEFSFLPRMIKPLTLASLQSFLVPKSEEMIRRLRPTGRS
jgi:hypothetical protein